jgi:GAF domain-containing protein
MQKSLLRLFAPPVFPEDDEATASAAILNIAGWTIIVVLMVVLALRIVPARLMLRSADRIVLAIIFTAALAIFIARRGFVRAASLILITAGWIELSYLAWSAEGIRDIAFFGCLIPILMAGLLLGWQATMLFTLATIASGWGLAFVETNRLLLPSLDPPLAFARDVTAVFLMIGLVISLTITRLQNALKKSRALTEQLSSSNKELDELRIDLEQRVQVRTSELSRRASQLEAVSTIARTVASVQDLDVLLPNIAKLIGQQFGFYHVGIFLLDEARGRAVLRAANSEGGARMIKQNYSLPLDPRSMVGYSISHREPRVTLDVERDPLYIQNPVLPEIRSEMVLPLRIASRVIGALDVQSTDVNAFSQEDIHLLATLTDQVAIAIENANLLSEARKALSESRAMFDKYAQQEWSNFARQAKQTGFIFDGKQIVPFDSHPKHDTIKKVIQTGSLTLEKSSSSIAIPLRLRGQTIGVLDIRSKKGEREWTQDEITLLEAAAERAALALENARLVESAQRRAARERAIGDIATRIGAVSNLESILQTAVEELGRKIGGATEVTLEIHTDAENHSH